MINLVKDVTIKSKVGARTKRARNIAILIVLTNCAGSSIAATDKFTIGAVSAEVKLKKNNKTKNILK